MAKRQFLTWMAIILWSVQMVSAQRHITLLVRTTGPKSSIVEAARRHGGRWLDQVGTIAIVRMPADRVSNLARESSVLHIEANPLPRPVMDTTPGAIHADQVYGGMQLPQAYTGEGVVSGVLDLGYLFSHPAFVMNDGTLRVKYYYDLVNDVVYDTAESIREANHSSLATGYSHGTHVMGIMAGKSEDVSYPGIAYGSDICAVEYSAELKDFTDPDGLTTGDVVLGVKRIFDYADAQGKPCVINFSSKGPSSLFKPYHLDSEALNLLLGPGHILCAGSGNDGRDYNYILKAAGKSRAGAVLATTPSLCEETHFDVRALGSIGVKLSVLTSNKAFAAEVNISTDTLDTLDGQEYVDTVTTTSSRTEIRAWRFTDPESTVPGNTYHFMMKRLNKGVYSEIYNAVQVSGDAEAEVFGDQQGTVFTNVSSPFGYTHAQQRYTVGWPACMERVVGVGAIGLTAQFVNVDGEYRNYQNYLPGGIGSKADFSSVGPSIYRTPKPDVVAPGVAIKSAFNHLTKDFSIEKKDVVATTSTADSTYYWIAMSGTSMATPVVSGVIALWLEAKPDLTPEDVVDILRHTSSSVGKEPLPNDEYGNGLIDAYEGLLYIHGVLGIEGISSHQPADSRMAYDGHGKLEVSFEGTPPPRYTVTVYTTDGRLIRQHIMTPGTDHVSLSDLSRGVYIVQLNTGDRRTTGSTMIRVR